VKILDAGVRRYPLLYLFKVLSITCRTSFLPEAWVRYRSAMILLALIPLTGCGGSSSSGSNPSSGTPPITTVTHTYNGSASVGDFLTVTVDPTALTISYQDFSNGQSGTAIPYTWNTDSSYAINDPAGNLAWAYEVPGYGLVVGANRTGPGKNSLAVITALEAGPATLGTFAGTPYNTMNFRTTAGGFQVGSAAITGSGGTESGYWPYGALSGSAQSAVSETLPVAGAVEAGSGTYLTDALGAGETAYLFGQANGLVVMDTPTGSVVGVPQAASSAFNPAYAHSYKVVAYQKTGVTLSGGQVETGVPAWYPWILVVSATGELQIVNELSDMVFTGTLTPVADAAYLYGGGGAPLASPCNGMFTCRITPTTGVQQDVFLTFVVNDGQGFVLFSSFWAPTPWVPGTSTYNYFYGSGLLIPGT
jgi:hypothetical protein